MGGAAPGRIDGELGSLPTGHAAGADRPARLIEESPMLAVITEATPEADGVLRLRYADGVVIRVDLQPVIAQGGVFSPLADPTIFAQVVIGAGGRFLEWPGAI